MGLFDKLKGAFGSGGPSRDKATTDKPLPDEAEAHLENPEKSDILLDPELLEGKVNVNRRAEIIDTYYDDVTMAEARLIAETLKEYIEGYDLRKHEAKKRIESNTELNQDRVTTIFWTERASIQVCDTVARYQDMSIDVKADWLGADGEENSDICREVAKTTSERGGVTLNELQELLRNTAQKYDEGTPERMDHWVPHHKCKCTLTAKPD